MKAFRITRLLAIPALLLPSLLASDPIDDLPECEFDTEIQFYNAEIDVLELPEECTINDLVTIGLILQDVVDEVESGLPRYREEKSQTGVCPYPEEAEERRRRLGIQIETIDRLPPHPEQDERRVLAAPAPTPKKKRRKKRYRYRGTGRCTRCKTNNNARRRTLQTSSVCSIAKKVIKTAKQVEHAAAEAAAMVESMRLQANNETPETIEIMKWADDGSRESQEQNQVAANAAEAATRMCVAAAGLRSSSETLIRQVETEAIVALTAAKAMKDILARVRVTKRRSDTLYYVGSSREGRELRRRRRRRSPRPAPRPAPGPFGIEDLVLVDAKRDRDIVAIGTNDCEPLDRCFGSATRFNIRAKTFGDVGTVHLTSEGPIKEKGRDEGIPPFSVWGDDGYGRYYQEELRPGTYTVTARATDRWGEKSSTFVKTFTVDSANSQLGTGQTTSSFGIEDLILVDAKSDRDIVAIGTADCEPLNACFGSATSFNIRAKTFGDVDSVYVTSDGPIVEIGRTEGIPPYSVWGDDGYGNYYRNELVSGTYTVTARATDDHGRRSSTFTKTFTVLSPSDMAALSAPAPTQFPTKNPTPMPTKIPTASPTSPPTEGPTSSPTGSPSAQPTASPTGAPTGVPTDSPTTSPTEMPTVLPTKGPSGSPTTSPTTSPTRMPTSLPTILPTASPTGTPTGVPTATRTNAPVSAANAPPQGDYTQMPSSAPSSNFVKSLARTREEYLNRFSENLAASNTECEGVKQAVLQKTMAEESAVTGDQIYDEIVEASIGFEGNTDVERIKSAAKEAHDRVQEEAVKAAAAADLASDLCNEALDRSVRHLQEDIKSLVQEEAEVAANAALASRKALSEEKSARDEMQEVVALIEFDPVMSELEAAIKKDEKILVQHLDAVETEILEVDSQIQTLPQDAPEVAALENKRDSLIEEEMQIEEVLINEEQFVISQSALKKDEFYESVAPDFEESPPLQYILRSRQADDNLTVETNWDPNDEVSGSKEAWFRRFGDLLVVQVPSWLMKVYNTTTGGCITEDTELSTTVVVTELETVWEQFDPDLCALESLTKRKSETPSFRPSEQPSMTPSGRPTSAPSATSPEPSSEPSSSPSFTTLTPSFGPSLKPSIQPSVVPSSSPSRTPSAWPSDRPTVTASEAPSIKQTDSPSSMPSSIPSDSPTIRPSVIPTVFPSQSPSLEPTDSPTGSPSAVPSTSPTTLPSKAPSLGPSSSPSSRPSPRPSREPTEPVAPIKLSIRLADTRDDGEEYRNSPPNGGSNRRPGHVDLESSDLEFAREDTTGGERHLFVGLRFQFVDVPQGATITNAYISLAKDTDEYSKATAPLREAVDLTIRGELSSDASQFTHCPYDCSGQYSDSGCNRDTPEACYSISTRANESVGTPNVVLWRIPKSDLWSNPGRVETPNIASVIQDIVNLEDWEARNSLVVNVFGSADLNDDGSRIARASDSCKSTFDCAPILEIEYIPTSLSRESSLSSESCPETASGPIPEGGRAIWSSVTRKKSGTPYYREFDGAGLAVETTRGANAIFRYTFGQGASSPTCYEQMFVGVTANNKVSGTRWDGSAWKSISMDKTNVLGTVTDSNWNNIVGAYESLSGRAILVYNKFGSAASPRYSIWDGTSNGVWPNSIDVDPSYSGDEPQWFDIASNPLSDEITLVFSDKSKRIFVTVWDGSAWTQAEEVANGMYQSGVGIAYESVSGQAMVVYGKSTMDNVYYRIYDGSSWSGEKAAFPLGTASAINWVSLSSDPRSNRVALSVVIDNGCFWLSVYDNGSWVATRKGFCGIGFDRPSVSVSFESKSSDAIAVFALIGNPKILYFHLPNGSTTWTNEITAGIGDGALSANTAPTSLDLYANPDLNSNQIMLMVQYDSGSLYAVSWNGVSGGRWATEMFPELDSDTGQTLNQPFAFVWN